MYWSGDRTRHLRADCRGCGRYMKFLSRTPENVALVSESDVRPTLFDDD